MSVNIDNLAYNGPLTSTPTHSIFFECVGWDSLNICAKSANNPVALYIGYSYDGTSIYYTQLLSDNIGPTGFQTSAVLYSKFIKLTYNAVSISSSNFELSVIGYKTHGVSVQNIGDGYKLVVPHTNDVRTVVSSNSTIFIAADTSIMDITTNTTGLLQNVSIVSNILVSQQTGPLLSLRGLVGSNITITNNDTLVYLTGTSGSTLTAIQPVVNVGNAPNYSLTIGVIPSLLGAFALTDKTTIYNSGQLFTYMGHSCALNATGSQNTMYGYSCGIGCTGNYNTLMGVAAGRNILSGGYNTMLGWNSGFSVGQLTGNFNTGVGAYAGAGIKDGCQRNTHFGAICGYQSPENSSVNRQCCFGAYAGYTCPASDIVVMGDNALNGATSQGSYSVSFGSGCAQNTTAGSLNFGSSMEAIHTTATAGIRSLPSNPTGFLPITWNGIAYKIPIYLP